jgi:hypothetical protein
MVRKNVICTNVLFRTVYEMELLQCTVSKLIRKRYYILFLILIFIVHVTKVVQFTLYNTFLKIPPTSVYSATGVGSWCVACLHSVWCTVQPNNIILETIQNRTRTHMLFCLEWPILWPLRILAFPPGTSCIYLESLFFPLLTHSLNAIYWEKCYTKWLTMNQSLQPWQFQCPYAELISWAFAKG